MTRLCCAAGVAAMAMAWWAAPALSGSQLDQHADAPASQPANPQMDPAAMAEMMKKWEESCTPKAEHKWLARYAGQWTTNTKMWMGGPDAPASVFAGKATFTLDLDGRWLRQRAEGEMMGKPWTGEGLLGYDNYKKAYVGNWVDNMSTSMLTMSGYLDPDGKTMRMYGVMDEPMMDMSGKPVRYVTTWTSDDAFTFQIFDLHGGEQFKAVEIAYQRVK